MQDVQQYSIQISKFTPHFSNCIGLIFYFFFAPFTYNKMRKYKHLSLESRPSIPCQTEGLMKMKFKKYARCW